MVFLEIVLASLVGFCNVETGLFLLFCKSDSFLFSVSQ